MFDPMVELMRGCGRTLPRVTRVLGVALLALTASWVNAAPAADAAPLSNATATTSPAPAPSPESSATPAYTFPIPEALHPLDVHPRTSLSIVEQLRHNHYLQKPLDDAASSELFDKYIDLLDSGHAYFLASDIQALEKYRYALDDALKRGDLDPAFDIFNRYQVRLEERLEFLITELGQGLKKMNFNTNETIEIERKHAPWAATTAELDDLWRKRLKAAVLAMKLNGKQLDEIQDVLTKRYKNRLKQATQTNSEDAFQVYVNAYASTYDPHTQYFSPRTSENFNINMSLSLEGIGAVLRTEDDYTEVVRLVPAGPADKAGALKPSDRIIGVGQGETGKLIDVVGWRLDDVVELIRGPKASVVRLEIIPAAAEDSKTRIVSITRNTVELEEQSAQKKVLTLQQGGVPHKIGIIEIPTFYVDFKAVQEGNPDYKSTTRDVHALIDQLKAENVEGIIIDLRNNGGGSLQEADSLTGLFIKSGPTVQVKTANRRANIYADTDDEIAWDGPLAVMVNRLSASASEIFAGAIQDYGRGLIIGSQTFGKGTVQTLIPLNRGQLKITQAKFYRVSGESTQHEGVKPDVEFPEVYDTDKIGESSLEDSMPWDEIKPAVYTHATQIQSVLQVLVDKHKDRVANDPDFDYLRALMQKSHEASKKTEISLNEAVRIKEKQDDDAWRLGIENKLRAAKGEPLLKSIEELDAKLDAEEAEVDSGDDAKKNLEDDAMIREGALVLIDYVNQTRQVASIVAAPKPGTAVQ
jgi:carboxyl-terminal processing protease